MELPRSVQEALEIDWKNGNTFWEDSLTKEMSNVCVAFEILGPNERAPPGWHKASGHIIFDIKMDITCIAYWVKDGHKTPDSPTPSFAGVVSRESIQIALAYAASLGLPVWGADIRKAYLQTLWCQHGQSSSAAGVAWVGYGCGTSAPGITSSGLEYGQWWFWYQCHVMVHSYRRSGGICLTIYGWWCHDHGSFPSTFVGDTAPPWGF